MAGISVPLDEVVYFDVITCSSTGAAADATGTPTWAVYEEDTDTAIQSGNFTKRTGLTGNYRGSFTASAANGFEVGKWYSVIASATVSSVAGKCVALIFRVVPAETGAGVPKVDVARANGVDQSVVLLTGVVDGVTFTPTTTEFETASITTAAADHYNGRVIIFTSGTLSGQATLITDYSKVGSNGRFVVNALTSAPENLGTFVIY
jgi:hypothetical protein